jgi:1-phosphofructokinase
MIVTVTPHPSVDRTVRLSGRLERGAVLRASDTHDQPAGKGVNVSRAALAAGLETTAVVPVAADDPFVAELAAAGLPCRPVGPAGAVRVNLTLTEPDGTTTKVNTPAGGITDETLDALERAVVELADDAAWVVLAGSLPPSAPADWHARLAGALRRTTARVAVDTSEAPLVAVIDGLPGCAPHLMKPNGEELALVEGGDPALLEKDPVAAARAARVLVSRGVETVLATLGGNGAVLVTETDAWHAAPPPTTVVSTVGAGDSSLFGYLLGDIRGLPPARRLALAVAYGSAAAGLPGTTIPQPSQVHAELVSVRPLDLTQGG